MKLLSKTLFLLIFLVSAQSLSAHDPNHSYIFLKVYENRIIGRIEFGALDINRDLGLNLNPELIEEEVNAAEGQIIQHFSNRFSISSNSQAYNIEYTDLQILALDDEADNIQVYFELKNLGEIPDLLNINFAPFFEKSNLHRTLLIVEHNWKAGIINNHMQPSDIFTPGDTEKVLSLTDSSLWNGFLAMIKLGMWHIWIGLDHILFLVALILPSVVRRRNGELKVEVVDNNNSNWLPVAKFKPAFLYILGIVTSFTVAHSITLAIAALGVINLPSRYVESIIAFSIALAAFHNIRPIFKTKEWIIAFAFGLFHGFGFASVLGEKGLAGEFISLSLLGFNVGVEIGQVLIVAGIFPILFFLRKLKAYPGILTYGSVLLILISLHWVVERLFEIEIRLGRFLDSIL